MMRNKTRMFMRVRSPWIWMTTIVLSALLVPSQSASALHSLLFFRAFLDGGQVVLADDADAPSGTDSAAFGKTFIVTSERSTGRIKFFQLLIVVGIDPDDFDLSHGANSTAMHVHRGGPLERGPIIIDIGFLGTTIKTSFGFIMIAIGELTQVQGEHDTGFTPQEIIGFLESGEAYWTVHTQPDDYPFGELRGNF